MEEEVVKWEYRIISLNDYSDDLEQTKRDNQMLFDALGLDGWELVTVRKDLGYFKRRFVKRKIENKIDSAYIDAEQFESRVANLIKNSL